MKFGGERVQQTTHQSLYHVAWTDILQYQAYPYEDGGWSNVTFSPKSFYFGAKRFA